MHLVQKYFPYSFIADNLRGLITSISIYVIANFAGGFVFGILSLLPLVGFIAAFAGWLLGVYCAAGAILSFLIFFHVLN